MERIGHSCCCKGYSVGDCIGNALLLSFPLPASCLGPIKYISWAFLIAKQELAAQAEAITSELMVTGEYFGGGGQKTKQKADEEEYP